MIKFSSTVLHLRVLVGIVAVATILYSVKFIRKLYDETLVEDHYTLERYEAIFGKPRTFVPDSGQGLIFP